MITDLRSNQHINVMYFSPKKYSINYVSIHLKHTENTLFTQGKHRRVCGSNMNPQLRVIFEICRSEGSGILIRESQDFPNLPIDSHISSKFPTLTIMFQFA